MHVAIIGNGISGITAARTIRKKSGCLITVISAESEYFFSRTALMYIYMGHMEFDHTKPYEDYFWKKNKIDLKFDRVDKVDFEKKTLIFQSSETLEYDKLIIATGSKPNKFGWPGQDLDGVQGLYSKQDLELLEKNTHAALTTESKRKVKRAVVVGGGLIGVELAEMLLTRNIQVTFLVKEDRFWGNVLPSEDANFILKHLRSHGVEVKLNSELEEILADNRARVNKIRTKNAEEIECQLVGLTAGVSPNISFLKDTSLEINQGILVDAHLKTNIPDVYAIGDCAEFRNPPKGRRNIEQVWYTGKMMGLVVGSNVLGKEIEYQPGPWFNSAKFFDIEYQTYGKVGNELLDSEEKFYWTSNDGLKCIKIISDKQSNSFIGINTFGIRLRHNLFDKWLREERDTQYVIEHIKSALFDPEFYKDETLSIVEAYNQQNGTSFKLKKRNWKSILP